MKSKNLNLRISSSLDSKNLHKKITQHIKGIIKNNDSGLSEQISKYAEKIPERIIFKNKQTHKYLYKKKLINSKFQWLNKYIENSELQLLPMNIQPNGMNKCGLKVSEQKQGKQLTRQKRSKTEAVQDFDHQLELSFFNKDQNFFGQRKSDPQNNYRVLKQISRNGKILSEKNFKLTKSKTIKDSKNAFTLRNQNIKPFILKQQTLSDHDHLMQRNISKSNHSEDKQNIKHVKTVSRKNLKIFIDENTPAQDFLECTARLNSSNLMFKNTSGYLKNRKRQYIFQSRQQKRQQSELLKIKRRFQQDITVEPWNLIGNDNEQNEETYFIMRNPQ